MTETQTFATNDVPRAIRVNAGVTQVELARRTGLSQAVISRIENGDNTTLAKVQAYARGCDATTAHIVAAMERRAGLKKGGALVRRHHGWRRK